MTENEMLFAGKVVIVTGAASGIGRATALAFAQKGASVALVDIERAQGEDALREAIARGGRAIFVEADVSIEADARKLVDQTATAFGGIDILHNNAGIVSYATVPEMSADEWDRVLAVNLKSVFLCSKYAIPEMVKRGGGVIVNSASAQGFASQPQMAAYAASKAGIIGMTRTMAIDHARDGIRVACVCPGPIDTPMVRRAASRFSSDDPDAAMQGWADAQPIGRIGAPEEVANTVLYLASPDASLITGSALILDGGLLASLM